MLRAARLALAAATLVAAAPVRAEPVSMPRDATDDVRSRAAEALADQPTRWR